ncbi:MAG: hypothetical protein ABI618_03240 [Nitrospirota bacterium]
MSVREDIDQYIEYLQTQKQEIAVVMNARPIYRKILYLIEIDTMSRAAFPRIPSNRQRVINFIDTCSNWPDKDRVSAVQLKFELEDKEIRSGQLYDFVDGHIKSWKDPSIIPSRYTIMPENDLTLQEVQRIMTEEENNYIHKVLYKELLYTYRNHLLHEFREPGKVLDPAIDLESNCHTPYYRDTEDGDPNSSENLWELQFPIQFLGNLCEGCISGLKTYLVANNLNPFESYKFGTHWRRS